MEAGEEKALASGKGDVGEGGECILTLQSEERQRAGRGVRGEGRKSGGSVLGEERRKSQVKLSERGRGVRSHWGRRNTLEKKTSAVAET